MPKFIKMIKTSESGNDFSSAYFDTDGRYFLANHPAANGIKSAAASSIIICSTGMLNWEPTSA